MRKEKEKGAVAGSGGARSVTDDDTPRGTPCLRRRRFRQKKTVDAEWVRRMADDEDEEGVCGDGNTVTDVHSSMSSLASVSSTSTTRPLEKKFSSVVNLHDESYDFSNVDSMASWTHRIFSELESLHLPSSASLSVRSSSSETIRQEGASSCPQETECRDREPAGSPPSIQHIFSRLFNSINKGPVSAQSVSTQTSLSSSDSLSSEEADREVLEVVGRGCAKEKKHEKKKEEDCGRGWSSGSTMSDSLYDNVRESSDWSPLRANPPPVVVRAPTHHPNDPSPSLPLESPHLDPSPLHSSPHLEPSPSIPLSSAGHSPLPLSQRFNHSPSLPRPTTILAQSATLDISDRRDGGKRRWPSFGQRSLLQRSHSERTSNVSLRREKTKEESPREQRKHVHLLPSRLDVSRKRQGMVMRESPGDSPFRIRSRVSPRVSPQYDFLYPRQSPSSSSLPHHCNSFPLRVRCLGDSSSTVPRRDSGVGSSLSRSPSVSCRVAQSCLLSVKDVRDIPSPSARDVVFFSDHQLPYTMDSLSVTQMASLRKKCSARVGELLGRGSPSTVHKIIQKIKNLDVKGNKDETSIFGASLESNYRRTGQCLPRPILEIMRYLKEMAPDTMGIFRRNGVKSKIQQLRTVCDKFTNADVFIGENVLQSSQVHDVADLLKQYLREIPDSLLTTDVSSLLVSIYENVPEECRLEGARCAILLLPVHNREALQTVIFFLAQISHFASSNNMPAKNIAVCLAPSIFNLSMSRLNVLPNRRHRTVGGMGAPSEKDLRETRSAQNCLADMITRCTEMFTVSRSFITDERENELPLLGELQGGPAIYLEERITSTIKENLDRWKGWIVDGMMNGVEMSWKKTDDGPLRQFRVWTDIEAPPKQVMHRIMRERSSWDHSLVTWRNMDSPYPGTEIVQYVANDTVGHPTRDYLVIRMTRSDTRGTLVLAERSIFCSETQLMGGISGVLFDNRFLIEPYEGRGRCIWVSRCDMRGRGASWYSKNLLPIMARQLYNLRTTFERHIDGPETVL